MRSREQRLAADRGEGRRAGLYETGEESARSLVRRLLEAEACDRFPDPWPPREVLEEARDRTLAAAAEQMPTGPHPPGRWITRGAVTVALTGGVLMLLAAHAADASYELAAGGATAFAAWLLIACVPVARLADGLERAAIASLLEGRVGRIARRLAEHEAVRRRRREYVEIESKAALASFEVGLAEGKAAVEAAELTQDLEGGPANDLQ